MILFPTAKINLGLRVTEKRSDGFHNIESIFYPVPLCDVMEFAGAEKFGLKIYGELVPAGVSENLVSKTWKLLHRYFAIPPVEVVLMKNIPAGSGLGGGSADAAFFLKGLNDFFDLKISPEKLLDFALQLGSDCPFFLQNKPALVTGRGEVVRNVSLDLSGLWLVLVVPGRHISTAEMFSKIQPKTRETSLTEIISEPTNRWSSLLINDFEAVVFSGNPYLAKIKQLLIEGGAVYASMTGTGSALYGLFPAKPDTDRFASLGTVYRYRL